MNLKIQGTIVGADYDDEFFASWIDRGLITPSSRVVAALENATEPVSVFINSFGGDVFAGGEMLIALQKCRRCGNLASVEVGAIAASMAANIVAALKAEGATITAHANSQLMFHGCYTSTDGGAQHHEDVAASLRAINEAVMANLKRCGVEECRAWFAEGREKWMGAEEAKALGLFDEVLESGAECPEEVKRTAARLAAFASIVTGRKEYAMEIDKTITVAEGEPAPAAEPVEAAPAAPVEETPAPEPTAEPAPEAVNAPAAPEPVPPPEAPEAVAQKLADERFAKLQAKHDKMISTITAERDSARADLEKATALSTSLRAEIDALKQSHEEALAALSAQLAKAESNRESVVAAALAPSASLPTLEEGLAKCNSVQERLAFLKAGNYKH